MIPGLHPRDPEVVESRCPAYAVGDVVRVVLLFYTMPAWSVLFAWWLLDGVIDQS